jgi:cellulose synthase/poly-beta-1,6-N-acetylglucosamine synthase-like glycosyltransferase
MKVLFWLSLILILYTYVGYPSAIALVARFRPKPWCKATWPDGPPPISIVMAVHNGAAMMTAKLEHLLSLDERLVREVIVVCDGSTDATPEILRRTVTPRLQSILLPAQVGKSAAVNQGVAIASGEILLFVDIRPYIEAGALSELLANFADPSVGCVAGELLLDTHGHDLTASAVSGFYWRYEQWIRNCEAAVDSPVGVYGGFYAVRRALATPAPAGLILDDMFQPLSIIRKGYRSVLARGAYVTDRWPPSAADEFQRKTRTLAGNFQLLQEAPWILGCRVAFQLISHKLMRLIVPWCFLLLLLVSAQIGTHTSPYGMFAVLQIAFWAVAIVSLRFRIPMISKVGAPASALLVLNAAAIAGLWKFLFTRGPLWRIWLATPVTSKMR